MSGPTNTDTVVARTPIGMSIEIVGPEKFAFQDLVCVDLMFRFTDDRDLKLTVEPLGGEDALVTLGQTHSERSIEVQVKGSVGDVKPLTVAACLAHFPPHKASLRRCRGDRQSTPQDEPNPVKQ
jgi:hypothetical protein